jgi:hypothetical protein
MSLVEYPAAKIREAAAKLPEPNPEKPDSAIDAGIRASAKNNLEGGKLTVPSQLAERCDELLAPPPTPEPKAAAKPAAKPEPVSAETKPVA